MIYFQSRRRKGTRVCCSHTPSFHPLLCVSRLRIIHAKKTGKRDASGGGEAGEEQHPLETPAPGRKRRRKGDSDYDDDDDDDSDDQADEDDEDEEDKEDKKGKKAEVCEDEVRDFKYSETWLIYKLKLVFLLFLCNMALLSQNLTVKRKEE